MDGAFAYRDALPACSWPASLANPPDAGVQGWAVGRADLQCGGDLSLTNATTPCGDASTCQCAFVDCQPDQYAVWVNWAPGLYPPDADIVAPDLPDGCTAPSVGQQPSSSTLYCCPCQ